MSQSSALQMLQTSTLRPGLLVSVNTSVNGGVKYEKRILERYVDADGNQKVRWETVRTIMKPQEYETAQTVRSRARSLIARPCSKSSFGYLCPEDRAEEVAKALADARQSCAEFNSTAVYSRVNIYVMTGRIVPDDVEAVKAINGEIRDLLETMKTGVEVLDVNMIREAANKARSIGQMLTPDAQVRIQLAIDAARKAARQITKAGETAAQEIDRNAITTLTESRRAFLDFDEEKEVATPQSAGRAVDFSGDAPTTTRTKLSPAVMDLD
jgi:hypothetical protein